VAVCPHWDLEILAVLEGTTKKVSREFSCSEGMAVIVFCLKCLPLVLLACIHPRYHHQRRFDPFTLGSTPCWSSKPSPIPTSQSPLKVEQVHEPSAFCCRVSRLSSGVIVFTSCGCSSSSIKSLTMSYQSLVDWTGCVSRIFTGASAKLDFVRKTWDESGVSVGRCELGVDFSCRGGLKR
jgi:hypothetical protein